MLLDQLRAAMKPVEEEHSVSETMMLLDNPLAKSELQELRIGDPILLKFHKNSVGNSPKIHKSKDLMSSSTLPMNEVKQSKKESKNDSKDQFLEMGVLKNLNPVAKSKRVLKIKLWMKSGENLRKRGFEEEEEEAAWRLKKQKNKENCNLSETSKVASSALPNQLKIRISNVNGSENHRRFLVPLNGVKSDQCLKAGEKELLSKRIRIRGPFFQPWTGSSRGGIKEVIQLD